MKLLLFTLALTATLASCANMKQGKDIIDEVVEVSCGMCNFDMTGDACALAVKINGKYYYVEGSSLKDHGNEHASDGMCNVVRKAKVRGRIKGGVFVAESFELIEE